MKGLLDWGGKGERVEKTPTRLFPPKMGGRTVGETCVDELPENPHSNQI